jgi:hypothetical protein
MDITEYLHNHLANAHSLLTALQSEQPRSSKDWNRTVAAIASVRAAMAIIQFLPPSPVTGMPTNDPAHYERGSQ